MGPTAENIDPDELRKFDAHASRWWDPHGAFKPLHDINPLRLDYIAARAGLEGRAVADIGCGGGLLSEAMAARGARVTGVDMSESAVTVARIHLLESQLQAEYHCMTGEALAQQRPGAFDVVTCMELLEHVPDPVSIVRACADLVRPGGSVFLSTLNRTPQAYLFAVLGAEYLLRLLPRRTHDYAKFIRPSELQTWCRRHGLTVREISGLSYHPLTRHYSLGSDIGVNYLLHAIKDD